MQSMNISLPEPLKQFVDGQISTGRYSSASEYLRELIRADEKRQAEGSGSKPNATWSNTSSTWLKTPASQSLSASWAKPRRASTPWHASP